MSGYDFHANALGVGGLFKSGGVTTSVPSLASVVLPSTGGEGSAVVENYSRNGVEFTYAASRVVGSQVSDEVYSTYADVLITNLTLFEKFRIAFMQASVSSTRNVNLPDAQFEVRAMFRGIQVGDEEIIPSFDIDLCNAPTYLDFANMVQGRLTDYATAFGHEPTALENAVKTRKPVRGTLASAVHGRRLGPIRREGTAIRVPTLGKVHLAEFLFQPGRRRVTLLRLELDKHAIAPPGFGDSDVQNFAPGGGFASPDSGDISLASVEGNGSPIGP
ncbi:MAG TPA: hypothetical protein VHL59_13240 [Thermoanaerobaculia bacterium]|nr:hypothetical protein [Thermoanaerobaculia bacterium]